jgi:hypothetical protein
MLPAVSRFLEMGCLHGSNDRLKTILEKQDATGRAYVAELARRVVAESLARASGGRCNIDV